MPVVALGAAGSLAEQPPIRDLVNPAGVEGSTAEQPVGGEDRAPDRPQLADRLGGVLRAGRVVAAARRSGGGDEALIEANGSEQHSGDQPFHDKRSSAESRTSSASESRTPSCPSRSSRPSTPGRATIT